MRKQELYLEGYGRGLPVDYRVMKVLQLASGLTAEKLLDIGCGDGSLSLALRTALSAKEVFGIEISAKGVEEAREKGIVCCELDVDENPLPFEDNSIGAIYAGELIEHLYDPDHLLGEIFRVLQPGGFAIIDTPNLAWWTDRLSLLLGYQPRATEPSQRFGGAGKLFSLRNPTSIPGGGGHLRVLTMRAFKQLLELHGFTVKEIVGAGGKTTTPTVLPSPLGAVYLAVDRFLCRFPSLAQFMIAVVDKSGSIPGGAA
jgi:SAM-dependent methyltransferase